MKKIYYLSTCDTCRRILMELAPSADVKLQDIKEFPITEVELVLLKDLSGSYESLINKRARLYQERGLKNKELSEEDFKQLIMEHYTFLKRPVILVEDAVFVGNARKTVEAAKEALRGS